MATFRERVDVLVAAANAAEIDAEELRLSWLGYSRLQEEEGRRFGGADVREGQEYRGMRVVIERPRISGQAPSTEESGIIAMVERATFCVAGRDDLGRWRYFDEEA